MPHSVVKLRSPVNSREQEITAVPSTEVKNSFGDVVNLVQREDAVAVTRHGEVTAIILSLEAYNDLVRRAGDPLERLTARYDQMMRSMQTAESKSAVDALFPPLPATPSRGIP